MAATAVAVKSPRAENRRQEILDAAAHRFAAEGYRATTMRDIAADAGLLAGSIYYHFPSKEDLLVAVHEEGVRRITAAVEAALDGPPEPWQRLERAATAHLEVLLGGSDYAQVVVRELPREPSPLRDRLVALRDGYDALFHRLVDDLPLGGGVDRGQFRLLLLGALNWTQTWYRPPGSGERPPSAIAAGFVALLRGGFEPKD